MPAETLCTAAGQPLSGPLLITPWCLDNRGFFTKAGMNAAFAVTYLAVVCPLPKPRRFSSGRTIPRSSRGVLRGFISSYPGTPGEAGAMQ